MYFVCVVVVVVVVVVGVVVVVVVVVAFMQAKAFNYFKLYCGYSKPNQIV